jgi:hypothetical protein
MEPCPSENPVESRDAGQTSPRRQPRRKRRFQIIKLEERIAPSKGGDAKHTNNPACYRTGSPNCYL